MIRSLLVARPRLSALLFGALAACGFAPLGLWPLTLLALAGLMSLIAAAPTRKAAALIGWLFGLGHFTLGNNWIATAFTYQANMPAWLGWIAVVALAGYLAVYAAFAALTAWHFRARCVALVLALAGVWVVSEWLRGWLFTGYAWNPLAMVALGPFDWPGLACASPWIGTYGLSGLVILIAGLWWTAMMPPRIDGRTVLLATVPVIAMLAPLSPEVAPAAKGTPFTIVQPDIAQDVLNDPTNFLTQFDTTTRLTADRRADKSTPRLVLWPESGMQFYLRDGYPLALYDYAGTVIEPATVRAAVRQAAGPQSTVLTGTVDLIYRDGVVEGAHNSVTALDGKGAIVGSYAKAHLVPYGEYLALRWLLEPLGATRLVPGGIDFVPGPGPRTLDLGPLGKVGVQICYEIIFPGEVVDRDNRPDYLFNPSNDGWFGAFGPPQHLAQARMRAIEEGLPVLRATTSGISAVIDARGRVVRHLPRFVAGRIDGVIPPALPPTPFARFGNLLTLLLALTLLVASYVDLRRGGR